MSLEGPDNIALGGMGQQMMNGYYNSSFLKNPNLFSGLGDIGGGLASLFGLGQNPANASEKYLNQIPGVYGQYLNPYIQNGNQAFGNLQGFMNRGNTAGNLSLGAFSGLVNNPAQFMNQLGSTFQQSPGYNWENNQALQAANRASAAGGMAGSPAEQQQIAGVTGQLANQDYYNYLNHVMSLFGSGLSGLQDMSGQGLNASQGVYNTGANASSDIANSMAQYYANQGNLAYAGAQNQNNSMFGGLGALASGLGSLFSL